MTLKISYYVHAPFCPRFSAAVTYGILKTVERRETVDMEAQLIPAIVTTANVVLRK